MILAGGGQCGCVALDDTLFKRSGKKVFGAIWQHDGAAKGPKAVGFGTCFVVAGIVVDLPFLTRTVCLPVLARLWRPKHTGKLGPSPRSAAVMSGLLPPAAPLFRSPMVAAPADGRWLVAVCRRRSGAAPRSGPAR